MDEADSAHTRWLELQVRDDGTIKYRQSDPWTPAAAIWQTVEAEDVGQWDLMVLRRIVAGMLDKLGVPFED